jgi:hypothetical protein
MRPPPLSALCLLCAASLAGAGETRFQQFTARFADAPGRATPVLATCLGGPGTEWLVGGGFAPDGSALVAGVALGPVLELAGVKAQVLGGDAPAPPAPERTAALEKDGKPRLDKEGRPVLLPFTWRHAAATAFVARLSPDLKQVQALVRFPWSAGGVTSACVDADGAVYLAGPAGAGIAGLAKDTLELPAADAGGKPLRVYLAKLMPDLRSVAWVRQVAGASAAPKVALKADGTLSFIGPDLYAFARDGKLLGTTRVPGGLGETVAVNPVDGTYARGGEHHSPTGREPWRCPVLDIHRADGALLHQLYDWGGPLVGIDSLRLVSDSAVRGVTYDDHGDLLIHAWSDGGNSVMNFQPTDLRRAHGAFDRGLGFSNWGAGVLSTAYVIRIETANYRVTGGTLWVSYLPDKNKPNSATIDTLGFAGDGSVAVAGRAALGLIRTGNHLGGDGQPGGPYVALFDRGFSTLRFSSTMPACGKVELANDDTWGIGRGTAGGKQRVLFCSGAVADDRNYDPEPRAAPALAPLQPGFAGGQLDGYLLVLDL